MNRSIAYLGLAISVGLLFPYLGAEEAPKGESYSKENAQQFFSLSSENFRLMLENNSNRVYLVDVREPYEFASGHISGAINLPLSRLSVSLAAKYAHKPVLLYCRSGVRSLQAYEKYFSQSGAVVIYHLEYGVLGWEKAGGVMAREF